MKLRVLHCPTSTGGQAWHLSRAERALGIESDVLVAKSHPFDYSSDINLKLEQAGPFSVLFKKIRTFSEAAERYDIFHFNYGSSLLDFPYLGLHHLDFSILKRKNKKIFITYQGCDSRIRGFCLKNFQTSVCHKSSHWHCSAAGDWVKKMRIQKARKFADGIFALNPDLLYNLPGASLEFYAIAGLETVKPVPFENPAVLKILHAPSNPEIKGTDALVFAVNRLKAEGLPVELILVTGKSHEEALRIYTQAHIVVDQLHAGWYGAFAAEAMALGKPVLCYLRKEDLEKFVPFRAEIPILNTGEENLYQNLKGLIQNPELRRTLGEKSRVYAEKYHDPADIAGRMLTRYEKAL